MDMSGSFGAFGTFGDDEGAYFFGRKKGFRSENMSPVGDWIEEELEVEEDCVSWPSSDEEYTLPTLPPSATFGVTLADGSITGSVHLCERCGASTTNSKETQERRDGQAESTMAGIEGEDSKWYCTSCWATWDQQMVAQAAVQETAWLDVEAASWYQPPLAPQDEVDCTASMEGRAAVPLHAGASTLPTQVESKTAQTSHRYRY